MSATKVSKADRKFRRRVAWVQNFRRYQDQCRDLIADLRRAKAAPEDFQVALKRARHNFSRVVAGPVQP